VPEASADRGRRGGVLLCADDFAMTNGVSRAVIELAEAGRLSATSAMTNMAHWPSHATWIARARHQVSVGLHLNLTLGHPLGAMPKLAPDRRLPPIGQVTALAIRGGLDTAEIAAEIERQLVAFEVEMGLPPDHIDGHQHVHALPQVRDSLRDVLARRFAPPRLPPLVRDPADQVRRIIARGRAVSKSLAVAWLSRGFGRQMRAAGFPTNDGFAGVTDFANRGVDGDFKAAMVAAGPRHMVMCHPGFVDDELARIDPVTNRRRAELDVLMNAGFGAALWRPNRSSAGDPIDWASEWTGTEAPR